MNIGEDGIVSDGIVIADIYRLMDCEKYPELVVSEVYQGTDAGVTTLVSQLMEPSMSKEIAKLPQKRHCQACNKLIDIKSGQKKRYCDGSKCRQAAFMLRKQVLETGEWCGDVFKFSHKGQLKGGEIIPKGSKGTYEIHYQGSELVVSIIDTDTTFSKEEANCLACRDLDEKRVVCQLSKEVGSKLHLGKAVTILEGFLKNKESSNE